MECRRGLGWSAKQAPLLNQRREWVQDTMSGSLSLARRSSAALASYLHDSIRGSRVEPSRSRRRNPRCERKQRPEGVGPKKSGKAISPKSNSCRSRNGDAALGRTKNQGRGSKSACVGRHNLCWIGCGRIPNVSCDTGPQKRKNSTHAQRYA